VNVLLTGSGGREHALAWKLSASPQLEELHAAPGNPGIAKLGTCHPVRVDDSEGLLGLCRDLAIELVVVGPESPLVAGMADRLRQAGVAVFGPSREAARIEGSKRFAKDVMQAAGVPTARTLAAPRPPCVVKVDGLAAGKGVFVCRTESELDAGLRAAARFGGELVIEELLVGDELSLFALADGRDAVALAPAQDSKRLEDGDRGPNTGGMGAFSPVPRIGAAEVEELLDTIHRPTLNELAARGTPFVGLLYAGLMLTDDGPRVLEFNCRFGDPETQAILPRIDGDLLSALVSAAAGSLEADLEPRPTAAVTIVVAGERYPEQNDVGSPIAGLEEAEATGALVFHAGTALHEGRVVTSGGRILNVTGRGDDIASARRLAYSALAHISFPGMRYRTDIADAASRAASGVHG
jgi:phosphoribosylamine--glycine ligase